MAATTNKGQEKDSAINEAEQKTSFSFSVCYDKQDNKRYIMLYPNEVVKGWQFEDYVKAGFNISVTDND